MGGHLSKSVSMAKRRSDMIDKQIEEDSKRFKRECNILVLGTAGSGKTTIMRQMEMIHQDVPSYYKRAEHQPTICMNVLESTHQMVTYMKKIGLDCEVLRRALLEKLLQLQLETPNGGTYVPIGVIETVHRLWKALVAPKLMEDDSSDKYSAAYFLEVAREKDALAARSKASAIQEVRFNTGLLTIRMFEVGGLRSERKKWIHCFESVTSIVFCTALSDYDQISLHCATQNRMAESLLLFESVINSRWFLRTSIILLMTKVDEFKTKLPMIPLERYFPEYSGGSDINKAVKYILWKFMQANRARLSVYPHLTTSDDPTVVRLIFAAVKETILQNALKDSGIL